MTEEKKTQIATELKLCMQVLEEITKDLSENGHDMAVSVMGSTYYSHEMRGMKTYSTVYITDCTAHTCKTAKAEEGAIDGIL